MRSFNIRADKAGARVKLTKSDTTMAKAIVNPKLLRNFPTIPLRKATGTKTASSESVVAITLMTGAAVLLAWMAMRRLARGGGDSYEYGIGKLENLSSLFVAALMALYTRTSSLIASAFSAAVSS